MKRKTQISRTLWLLIAGVAYLALLGAVFGTGIDLAADKPMQYALHITVILSAFIYLFFTDMIYRTQENKADARLALVFAALFTLPVLIGRGIGLLALSDSAWAAPDSLLNFYGTGVSLSRSIELLSWTVLFPLSMVFLFKVFLKQKKLLAWLCLISAACCFIAFISFFSSEALLLWIGVAGWGPLFLLIVIVYLIQLLKHREDASY